MTSRSRVLIPLDLCLHQHQSIRANSWQCWRTRYHHTRLRCANSLRFTNNNNNSSRQASQHSWMKWNQIVWNRWTPAPCPNRALGIHHRQPRWTTWVTRAGDEAVTPHQAPHHRTAILNQLVVMLAAESPTRTQTCRQKRKRNVASVVNETSKRQRAVVDVAKITRQSCKDKLMTWKTRSASSQMKSNRSASCAMSYTNWLRSTRHKSTALLVIAKALQT